MNGSVGISQETVTVSSIEKQTWRNNASWKRFKKNKLALFGAFILLFLLFVAAISPLVAPYDPYVSNVNELGGYDVLAPPSSEHLLGTDSLGRDMLSRIIYGGRVSLSVAFVAVMIATVTGIILGVIAGYYGKWVDTLIMRITDVVICFPVLFLAITVATILKPSLFNVMIIIGLVSWTTMTRLVRGEVLKLREMEYIEAAKAMGQRNSIIIFRHILPNILAPIVVQATLQTAEAILTESALSFLGVGVQQPVPSWGNMLNEATSIMVLQFKPWVWAPAGFAILLTILSINFVGDGLRDAMDPKVKN
ncbi:oligopeptide ABC transporter permease [Pseudoneobacillus rhizosphaerae]|uniref:Glutathione transport system permease protein GsiD n=1 Tax=Pseudoneobacillus rhizosphaerae TaxID=2880968 RepID=A0A9C7G8X7_9BACI|nr:oligopeptide ABC transporter permease [Pseudoneobacillus rhizosphaerae]CAG9607825.1 Glutathione transport system permease protein GsiD [Pseudoneobacillus rhizosphaerae]